MKNNLPNVFVNKKTKLESNNQSLFYSKESKTKKEPIKLNKMDKIKIRKKINELFSSPRFVYKLPVEIETEQESLKVEIVSKDNNKLLTRDNRSIKIDDIINIKEN